MIGIKKRIVDSELLNASNIETINIINNKQAQVNNLLNYISLDSQQNISKIYKVTTNSQYAFRAPEEQRNSSNLKSPHSRVKKTQIYDDEQNYGNHNPNASEKIRNQNNMLNQFHNYSHINTNPNNSIEGIRKDEIINFQENQKLQGPSTRTLRSNSTINQDQLKNIGKICENEIQQDEQSSPRVMRILKKIENNAQQPDRGVQDAYQSTNQVQYQQSLNENSQRQIKNSIKMKIREQVKIPQQNAYKNMYNDSSYYSTTEYPNETTIELSKGQYPHLKADKFDVFQTIDGKINHIGLLRKFSNSKVLNQNPIFRLEGGAPQMALKQQQLENHTKFGNESNLVTLDEANRAQSCKRTQSLIRQRKQENPGVGGSNHLSAYQINQLGTNFRNQSKWNCNTTLSTPRSKDKPVQMNNDDFQKQCLDMLQRNEPLKSDTSINSFQNGIKRPLPINQIANTRNKYKNSSGFSGNMNASNYALSANKNQSFSNQNNQQNPLPSSKDNSSINDLGTQDIEAGGNHQGSTISNNNSPNHKRSQNLVHYMMVRNILDHQNYQLTHDITRDRKIFIENYQKSGYSDDIDGNNATHVGRFGESSLEKLARLTELKNIYRGQIFKNKQQSMILDEQTALGTSNKSREAISPEGQIENLSTLYTKITSKILENRQQENQEEIQIDDTVNLSNNYNINNMTSTPTLLYSDIQRRNQTFLNQKQNVVLKNLINLPKSKPNKFIQFSESSDDDDDDNDNEKAPKEKFDVKVGNYHDDLDQLGNNKNLEDIIEHLAKRKHSRQEFKDLNTDIMQSFEKYMIGEQDPSRKLVNPCTDEELQLNSNQNSLTPIIERSLTEMSNQVVEPSDSESVHSPYPKQ